VGAVVGFALVFKGSDAVFWLEATPHVLPYYKGMVPICLGWIISPIMCAVVSAALFAIVRTCVLRRDNAVKMAIMVSPPCWPAPFGTLPVVCALELRCAPTSCLLAKAALDCTRHCG
jgi:phosphate/sulfate permease